MFAGVGRALSMRTKSRKRKIPVTTAKPARPSSGHPYSSRTLIREFHVLLKRRAQLQQYNQNHDTDGHHGDGGGLKPVRVNAPTLAEVEERIEDLGGLEVYQRMSTIGQGDDRGGGSHKVLISWLRGMGMCEAVGAGKDKLRLLEVGALKPDNYQSCAEWIECTPIDLRSRHPGILEQDFLDMDESEHRGRWDLVSLSLVLNFVPEARDRGRMLKLAYGILAPDGLLFLALPLPCVQNSRYLTFDHLKAILHQVGFEPVEERWRKGGKMAYWLYRKAEQNTLGYDAERFRRKVILRQGNRNNFCILL